MYKLYFLLCCKFSKLILFNPCVRVANVLEFLEFVLELPRWFLSHFIILPAQARLWFLLHPSHSMCFYCCFRPFPLTSGCAISISHLSTFFYLHLSKKKQLGTLLGVFLPCCQNILGILLFVRVGWITGVAGALQSFLIVLMCCSCVSFYFWFYIECIFAGQISPHPALCDNTCNNNLVVVIVQY